MLNKKFTLSTSTFLIFILTLIGLLFVIPWISFWIAYLGGWIVAKVIGTKIVEGLALFGIMIPISKIPLLAGTLGWIGAFFKNTSTISKSN